MSEKNDIEKETDKIFSSLAGLMKFLWSGIAWSFALALLWKLSGIYRIFNLPELGFAEMLAIYFGVNILIPIRLLKREK